ncbi:pyridoxal-dependent decarboxylase domain-containing protein 1 isoform X1 [Syngnathus typhle]|uniref:pyridoxal-dependent decarboxylase domain-containing protein 1 isoform X1 n=1 Tax=Syngnathus typhle TaxID=161592 RepID=UPI002A69AC4F|nr:pyridoxal-dependent decarboxylase domain-containing protein 1 isoform X1 [Syngnathus typhle]XP_061159022.1 pyridoxal-dependent decarboxylase domain-containing protein 1 isoform X1 [Syngnathus typhle]XP_061159023.1 pyridoxal-dependent decarboxylase domain-containing protein 1 isoform X1 [Syngnathus typhle]
MVDTTLVQVGMNLTEAMKILEDGQRGLDERTEGSIFSRASIPGPLLEVGQDVATILHRIHSLIHEEEEGEDKPNPHRMQNVGEQGHIALLGHSLAAYISVLDRERLWKLTTRILSDTTLWLCRLFRYENGSAYFHEDDREGLIKVCRLVIHACYDDYASEGFAVLSSKQPVIYQSASGRPGLGQHLCNQLGLPLSNLCTVPCNTLFGSQHQMDIALLEKFIKEDLESGKLPLLLIANAGTPGAGHTDKLGRLRDLCDQYKMWLHVEGVNLATLVMGEATSAVTAATKCDSMTLTPGPWLGLPAVSAVTLYRHEDPALSLAAGLTSSQPVAKLRGLPLWLSLQYLGHSGINQKITHAIMLTQQLLQNLKSMSSIKTSVEDELNSPVLLFRFSQDISAASTSGSVEAYCAGEKEALDAFNRWLGKEIARMVPASGVEVVELEDEGTCVRFSPLLTAADLGTQPEDVDNMIEKLLELVPLMTSTMSLRQDFKEETHQRSPYLRYIEELSWPGLGAVRYEPQVEGIDDSRRTKEIKKINTELLKKLQELDTDIVFSSGLEFAGDEDGIFISMVADDVDVSELVETIVTLGRDIEENGRLLENMTEVVRKGIREAELELLKANDEKLMEEGMLRQLPVVGSVLNWFSPVQASVKGRTFNLAAGSLDSTEVTYSTKAQSGRSPLKDSPTLSSEKLQGQKLFRRSGAGSDSISESSSVGQAEGSTSIRSSISMCVPEENSASRQIPEEIPESCQQKNHDQVEDMALLEEKKLEGQDGQSS